MKKILLFTIACISTSWLSAQFIYKIKADSVLITNDSCTAELNLENSTRHVLGGFLYNKGNGRTEFRKVIKKVFNGTDSVYVIGEDTLQISGGFGTGMAKDGLMRYGNNLYLGDTSYGGNTHNFTVNRFQYLNGKYYSFGGSKYDPNLRPALRIHDNGDVTFNTNNNYSVIPWEKEGMRYVAKYGLLQIGLSDPIDTTGAAGNGSGILINSDWSNTLKRPIAGSVAAMYGSYFDSTSGIYYSFINGHNFYFDSNSNIGHAMMSGKYHYLAKNVAINSSSVTGYSNSYNHNIYSNMVSGGYNVTQDISENSLVSGMFNNYGGVSQLVTGSSHNAKSPIGTYLGNRSVDFSSLTYTSNLGYNLPSISNLASYPVLSLGNSSNGTTRSNALTIMYTGRTQINTKGFNNNLNEADVIPKAALEVVSSNSGVLLPKLTTTQINSILPGDLHSGLILYNVDSNRFQYYNGTAWKFITNQGSLSGDYLQNQNLAAQTANSWINGNHRIDNGGISINKIRNFALSFDGVVNSNLTTGIRFENTFSGANAMSVLQLGQEINTSGSKFLNILYASDGLSEAPSVDVYRRNGTAIINTGTGGIGISSNGAGNIRFYHNGVANTNLVFSLNSTKADFLTPVQLGNLSADPTGSNGMMYYNTTSNKFKAFENGAWKNLSAPTQFKNIAIESPSASENLTYFYTDKAITITKVADVLRGSSSPSVTYNIRYATSRDSGSPTSVFGSNRSVTTTSGGTTTSFSNPSIPAGSWVWIVTSAAAGTVNEISIALTYTEN